MKHKFSILILDDEAEIVRILEKALESEYNVIGETEVEPARKYLAANRVDVLVLDYRLKNENGLDLLAEFKQSYPEMEVIMITGYGDIEMAVLAVKSGAFHFLSKPFKNDVLKNLIKKALTKKEFVMMMQNIKGEAEAKYKISNIPGSGLRIKSVRELVKKAQEVENNVLIIGENGTGKEFFARVIHTGSRRMDYPFLAFNCSTLGADDIKIELFGLIGSETAGTKARRTGIFEAVGDGTIFLSDIFALPDEIKEMVEDVIKTGEFLPIGGKAPQDNVSFSGRIIGGASGMDDSHADAENGSGSLYRQLSEFPIIVPPLRERGGDIREIAEYFLRRNGERLGKNFTGFSKDAINMICAYSWPGNLRHLENIIERVSILEDGNEITAKYLPSEIVESYTASGVPDKISNYRQFMKVSNDISSMKYMKNVLKETGGNVTKAASIAGMKRESFHRLLKKYKISSKTLQ